MAIIQEGDLIQITNANKCYTLYREENDWLKHNQGQLYYFKDRVFFLVLEKIFWKGITFLKVFDLNEVKIGFVTEWSVNILGL